MRGFWGAIGAIDGAMVRMVMFVAALVIYALWGSPTPDYPGVVEVLIALGLVFAVGVRDFYHALCPDFSAPLWRGTAQALLLYGLSIPVLVGIMAGQGPSVMMRDVLPFLFLFLPLFMIGIVRERPRSMAYILCGVLFIGVCFSVRASMDHLGASLSFLGGLPERGELTYLANAPTVLFTGLFLSGFGAYKFVSGAGARAMILGSACMALALIVFLPLILSAQRASLGYSALYIVFLTAGGLWRYPPRTALLIGLIALAFVPAYGALGGITHMVLDKTSLVGFNMRFEEMAAVWRAVSGDVLSLIFGKGWGAGFESPAVGGVFVHYTHNFLTSALLKTGLLGAALAVFYICALGRAILSAAFMRPVFALALAGPFVIDVTLYASFKSLDFGLVLLLIVILTFNHQNSVPDQGGKVAKPSLVM